jgi:hypothetical protein
MRVTRALVLIVFGLTAFFIPGTARGGGEIEPHPELPQGECEGSWQKPKVVVPFDGPNVVRRPEGDRGPYTGFKVRELFRAARRRPGIYADGYVKDRPRVYKATFLFTSEVESRLKKLRSIAGFPANIRGLETCYSIGQLERIQDLVGDGVWGKGEPDPPIQGRVEFTDIKVQANRVLVALRKFRRSDKEMIEARYGPAVRVLRGDHRLVPE